MLEGIGSWVVAEYLGKALLLARVPKALSTHDHPVGLWAVLPWRDLGRAMGAAALSGLGVCALRAAAAGAWSGLPPGFLFRAIPLGLAAICFAAGYVAVLRVSGVRLLSVVGELRRQ
jgi:hypothetical protein